MMLQIFTGKHVAIALSSLLATVDVSPLVRRRVQGIVPRPDLSLREVSVSPPGIHALRYPIARARVSGVPWDH